MKPIIIGIHGLGNKPAEKLLKRWWLRSIHEGLEKISKDRLTIPFELVYWADILHRKPLNLYIKKKEDPLYLDEPYRRGGAKRKDKKPSFRNKVLQYIEVQLDKIFLNDDLSINFKNVTDKIIHRFFSDLETYYGEHCIPLTDSGCSAKDSIQDRLQAVLHKYKGYEILLICHSMGSIVAFDVLSRLPEEITIHIFVTIGSPLGLPVIVSRIFDEQKKKNPSVEKPLAPDSIVGRWINMSDIEDKVALDHTLADDFGQNGRGILAEDVFVYNDYEINGEPNSHKSFGYLRTPEIATVINNFLISRRRDRIFREYKYFTKKIASEMNKIKNIFMRDKNEP